MKLAGLLVAVSCIGLAQVWGAAHAQQGLKFTTVDCSTSKIVAAPGLVCLVSNERAGGDFGAGTSEGLFKYWTAISRKDMARKTYYYAVEALETKSTVRIGDRLVDEIQRVNPPLPTAMLVEKPVSLRRLAALLERGTGNP